MRRRGARPPLPPGFGTIWTTVALDLIGFGIVLPILPLYARRFGAHAVSATALLSAFSLAQLVLAPVWGRVSDRVGRKPVLVLSLVGTAVGSLVTGLAGSLWVLYLGRLLDGASGASVSVAQAAVADLAPADQRARLLGLLGAAFGVGFVAGPALGGLAALGGPRLPFLLAAVVAGVNAVVAIRRLPETHRDRDAPKGAAPSPSAGEVGDLLALAFAALLAFSAFEATFALFGERRLGFGEAGAAGVFAGVGILLVIVQGGLVHPVVARLGEAGTMRTGLACNAVGLLVLAGVDRWWQLVPALVALTVGQGLLSPALSASLAGRVDPTRRGGVLGLQQSASGLARVVGPLAGGLAFQHVGVPAPYLGGAVLLAACAVLLVRERPVAAAAAP